MDPTVGDGDPRVSSATSRSGAGWRVYGMTVVGFVGALVVLDRSDSDVANQVVLLFLLVFAGVLGALRPRQAWLSALIIGCTIAVARGIELLTGPPPADPQAPRTLAAVATLLVLLVPAAIAAYVGAALRRAMARR